MSDLRAFRENRCALAAEKYNADLLIASLPENIYYLSEFTVLGLFTLSTNQAYLIYDPETHQKSIVTGAGNIPTALEDTDLERFYSVGNFYFAVPGDDPFSALVKKALDPRYPDYVTALRQAIKDMKPNAKRIIFDTTRLPIDGWQKLTGLFPDVTFIQGVPVFQMMRSVKHREEIDMLKKATSITEEALSTVISNIKPGISEYDMAIMFNTEAVARGSVPRLEVFGVDAHSGFSDTYYHPYNKVGNNSMIRFDIGATHNHFRSDIARTVLVGENPKVEEYYKAILVGQKEAIAAVRAGIRVGDIYDIAVRSVRKNGIPHYQRNHVGHCIGMESYEHFSITPDCDILLEEGMTINVETPYYEIGWGSVMVEDTLAVTKTGVEYLTSMPSDLIRLSF